MCFKSRIFTHFIIFDRFKLEFVEDYSMKKILILLSIFLMLLVMVSCKPTIDNPYTQEYVVGQGNIVGEVDVEYFIKLDERFAIGAAKNGMAVFKNPFEAYQALTEKYAAGIAVIKREFLLSKLSYKNYQDYKTYGWQVTIGTEEEKEQAKFVSKFLDIYENSFNTEN